MRRRVLVALWALAFGLWCGAGEGKQVAVFTIGTPDGLAAEFGLAKAGWQHYLKAFPGPVVYKVGKSKPADWPYMHPSNNDRWAGGRPHTFTIRFLLVEPPRGKMFLVVGLADAHPNEPSVITFSVNGATFATRKAPRGTGQAARDTSLWVRPRAIVVAIPEGALHTGWNTLAIRLEGGSWIIYDYVRLTADPKPPTLKPPVAEDLLERALGGPLRGHEEIVFAVRQPGRDGHWYANFGYYAPDTKRLTYGNSGKLCRLNLRTGKVTVLLDDPRGGVRDPQVHYDGKTILFSYRKGGSPYYHLYEINADGTGLRQITDGPWDDIEPTYLPDDSIVFCSSRCKRWVNCWVTHVAVLYKCDRHGRNLRMLSSNNEHDNTPWPLPDGRILYTRWEYVDRSQVHYHHLWVVNPDGTDQMVYFGNLHPGIVMIDAKPIPGTKKVVSIFSPGHGRREHDGVVTLIDPAGGPDATPMARPIARRGTFRDPYPLAEDLFLVARGNQILLVDEKGRSIPVFQLPEAERRAGLQVHEPRPLAPRPRERVVPRRVHLEEPTGQMILVDAYFGRNMVGVKEGEIKKLLVLETLPKPINFTGGMEPMSYGGTFTLERVLGTVPVEPDGSAYFEVPALRSIFFVALDENDMSVKRMQSFVTVQPGEVVGCAGCHESRTKTPPNNRPLMALNRPPSKVQPVEGVPDVLDFPRDIQPILDRHCVRCHSPEKRDGGVILAGDRGPLYSHSYYMLTVLGQFADGRNRPRSNYPPRALGTSASPLMKKIDGSHYDVKVSEVEKKTIIMWIETGAPYPGTYAALGTGMLGGYAQNRLDHSDTRWPSMRAAMAAQKRRCGSCHRGRLALPSSPSDNMGMPPWAIRYGDPRLRFSRHILYNLSRPDKSLLLLAPLAKEAGGYGICRTPKSPKEATEIKPVFASTADPDYQTILRAICDAKAYLDKIKRFDMPGFRPRKEWIREMQRYGILPKNLPDDAPIDPYQVERAYWRSFWWQPPRGLSALPREGP